MINRHCDRKAIGNKEQQVNISQVINTSGLNKKTLQSKPNPTQKLYNYSTMQSNVRNFKKKPGHGWDYQNYQNNHYNNRDNGYYNKGYKPNNKSYNNQRFNNQNNYETKYDSTNNSVTPPTPSSGSHSLNTTTSPTSDSASSSAAVNNNSNQNTNLIGTNDEVKPTNNQNSNEVKKTNNCTNSLTKEFAEWSLDLPNDKEVKPNSSVKFNNVNKAQVVTQENNSANVNLNKNTVKNTKNLQSKFYQMFTNVNKPNYHTYRNKKQVNNCLIKNTSSNQSNIPNIKNSHQKQIQQPSNPVKNYYDGTNLNAPVSQNHPMVSPYLTPNGVFYSFPTGQYFTPHQHHLNPHSSQNQPMPNTHPSNCLECQQQNSSYYNGNNFIAPSYHSFATPFLSLQHYPIQTAHTNQPLNGSNANLAPNFNAEIGHFLPQIPYNPYLHFMPPNYITVPNNESHQISTNLVPNSNLAPRNLASNFAISHQTGQQDQYTSNGENSSYENSRLDSSYEYGVNENRNNLVSGMHNTIPYTDQIQNMNNGQYLTNPNCYSAEYNGNVMSWQNFNSSKNTGDDLSSHSLVVNFSNENSENGFNDTSTLANSKNTESSEKK